MRKQTLTHELVEQIQLTKQLDKDLSDIPIDKQTKQQQPQKKEKEKQEQEFLLTEIMQKQKAAFLTLSDGKEQTSFYIDNYKHKFATKFFKDNEELEEFLFEKEHGFYHPIIYNAPLVIYDSEKPVVQIELPTRYGSSKNYSFQELKNVLKTNKIIKKQKLEELVEEIFDFLITSKPEKEHKKNTHSIDSIAKHICKNNKVTNKNLNNIKTIFGLLRMGHPIASEEIIRDKKDKTPKITIPSPLPDLFITGKYDPQMQQNIAPTNSICNVDCELIKILEQNKKINKLIKDIDKDIKLKLKKIGLTNIKQNQDRLDEAFEEYNGENYKEIFNKKIKGTFLERNYDESFFEKRKNLQDEIIEFNKTLKQTNSFLKIERIKSKEKNKERRSFVHFGKNITSEKYEWIKYKRMFNREDLKGKRFAIFDTEQPFYKYGDNRTTSLSIIISQDHEIKEKYVIATNKSNEQGYKGFPYIFEATSEKLVETGKSIMENCDIFVAYNIKHDTTKLRDDGDFAIGERLTNPVYEVTTKFLERMRVRGKICLDPMRWAKVYLKYLPNQKLVSTAKALDLEFGKSINYRQQEELLFVNLTNNADHLSRDTIDVISKYLGTKVTRKNIQKMQSLDMICGTILLRYVTEDTLVLPEIIESKQFQDSLDDLFFMSDLFKIEFTRLMHSTNTINQFQKNLFFENLGTYHDEVFPTNYGAQKDYYEDAKQYFKRKLKSNLKSRLKQNKIKTKTKGRISKQIYKVHLPKAKHFREKIIDSLMQNYREGKDEKTINTLEKFFNYIEEHKEDKNRLFFLTQYEESLFDWMLKDYAAVIFEKKLFEKHVKETEKQRNEDLLDNMLDYTKNTNFSENTQLSFGMNYEQENEEEEICKFEIDLEKIENRFKELKSKLGIGKDWSYFYEHNLNKKMFKEYKTKIDTTLMAQNELEEKEYLDLFNRWAKIEAKKRVLTGSSKTNQFEIEKILKQRDKEIIEFITKQGFNIVHTQDDYLYLSDGDENKLLEKDCPLIYVDKIDSAFTANNKIFYNKNGFIKGLKMSEDPQYHVSTFENKIYSEFLLPILKGDYEKALVNTNKNLEEVRSLNHRIKDYEKIDLLRLSKSTRIYIGYERDYWENKATKIKFMTPDTVKFDKKDELGEYFEVELQYNKKEDGTEIEKVYKQINPKTKRAHMIFPYLKRGRRKNKKIKTYEKYYIMNIDDFNPDPLEYKKKITKRLKGLLTSLTNKHIAKTMIEQGLSENETSCIADSCRAEYEQTSLEF